jgi:predicted lipoprotein with Yx(FWY)xxD motif
MRQQIRRTVGLTTVALLGLVGFLAADQMAGSATGRSNATLSLRQTKLGAILVNAQGRTLYLFTRDRNARSSCTAACIRAWPPLLARGKPTAGTGLDPKLVGTTRRPNGAVQVTYNRHPLYTFALDKSADQTSGQRRTAFGGRWFAVSARGTAVTGTVVNTTTVITTSSQSTSVSTSTTMTSITSPYP